MGSYRTMVTTERRRRLKREAEERDPGGLLEEARLAREEAVKHEADLEAGREIRRLLNLINAEEPE
jgi:hypothetical protein